MAINLEKLFVIDFRTAIWLPSLCVLATVLHMCIAFSDLEMLMVSYAVLGTELLSFLVMLILFLRKGVTSLFPILITLFQLLLLSLTIVFGMDIKNCFYWGCECILIAILMEYYNNRFQVILTTFAVVFSLCAYLNLFHIIANPQLWFIEDEKSIGGYLLGNSYNQMGCRLICAIITSYLCQKINKWWTVNTIFVIIASLIALFIVRSMTSLTCLILFSILCFLPYKPIVRLSCYGLLVFYVLFQLFVCSLGKGLENNELATYFIVDVLEKDITFSNRTEMWDSALTTFWESPLWGHGLVDGEWYLSHMNSTATGPHNLIFSFLIYGGVILLILFLYIFYLSVRHILLSKDKYENLCLIAIAVYLIMSTMEVYPYSFTLYLLILAYYFPTGNLNLSPHQKENNSPNTDQHA